MLTPRQLIGHALNPACACTEMSKIRCEHLCRGRSAGKTVADINFCAWWTPAPACEDAAAPQLTSGGCARATPPALGSAPPAAAPAAAAADAATPGASTAAVSAEIASCLWCPASLDCPAATAAELGSASDAVPAVVMPGQSAAPINESAAEVAAEGTSLKILAAG